MTTELEETALEETAATGIASAPDSLADSSSAGRSDGTGILPESTLPAFNLADPIWRDHCLKTAVLPAGYTYLAQLMGHDLGNSVARASMPHVPHPNSDESSDDTNSQSYNLIENPLTLETVYGKGPTGLPYLYDPRTLMFQLPAGALWPAFFKIPGHRTAFPLIADMRNRDTVMLLQLTTAWMQYHNCVARGLIQQEHGTDSNLPKAYFREIFADARAIVLQTWHQIILADLLPRICHPDVLALPKDALDQTLLLDEVSVLNGVMRAFHALPLRQYSLESGSLRPFDQLGETAIKTRWRIDWDHFFSPTARNKTAISASYSSQFKGANGAGIAFADLASAIKAGPLHGFSPEILTAQTKLPQALQNDLSATALTQLFNAEIIGAHAVSEAELAQSPLFLLLMLEAQFHGSNGGFGPFGSALLRRYLEHARKQVVMPPPSRSLPPDWVPPDSMSALIKFTQRDS